jgi:hypothetical protein
LEIARERVTPRSGHARDAAGAKASATSDAGDGDDRRGRDSLALLAALPECVADRSSELPAGVQFLTVRPRSRARARR